MYFFLTVPLVGLQPAIVTFRSHTHFLANIVFKHDEIHLLAKKEPGLARTKLISAKIMAYLTHAFSVKGLYFEIQLIIQFDQYITHSLLFKKCFIRTLLVLRFLLLCVK